MVKIVITDDVLQVTKTSNNGTTTDNLVWETPQGLPNNAPKGTVMVSNGSSFSALAPGNNGEVLKADPATATGLTWGAGSTASTSGNISVSLSQPFGSVTLTNPTIYQAIYWIPPDVTTVYASLGDRNLLSPNGNAAAIASMKIAGGQPSVDRQSFVGTPTSFTGLTIPPYMFTNAVALPVQRDASGYMMFRWTLPAGSHFTEFSSGTGQNGYCKLLDNSTDVLASAGFVDTFSPAGQFVIRYATTAPRLVIWSDSIQRGIANGTECGLLNSLAGLGPERGYAVSGIAEWPAP